VIKTVLESLDIYYLISELKEKLLGKYISKIYQVDFGVLIKIKAYQLLFAERKFLFLTNRTFKYIPSDFIQLLRKHLTNAKILDIVQPNFDRVVEFVLGNSYKLIFEFFGTGNIIVVKDNVIVAVLQPHRWAHRDLHVACEYKYPPRNVNLLKLDIEILKEILSQNRKIIYLVAVKANIGGIYSEEICKLANIDKEMYGTELNYENIIDINNAIKKLLSSDVSPEIVAKNGVIIDVVPIKLSKYANFEHKIYDNFSTAIETYFFYLRDIENERLKHEIKAKYEKQILKLNETLKSLENEITKMQRIAELIYQNYEFVNACLRNCSKEVIISDVKISIEPKLDIHGNVALYYEKIKTFKAKCKGIMKAIDELKTKMQQNLVEIEKMEKPVYRCKENWYEKYRWIFSSNGKLIIGGKDAKNNERIVKKHLGKNDIYVHADIAGGASVVVKDCPDEQSIIEACEFAGIYSKAWSAKLASVDIFWVREDQVSKTPPTGSYLKLGTFMIYGKKNYVKDVKLIAGIGTLKNYKKVVCGPISIIEKLCDKYVIFVPGDTSKEDFAKESAKYFNISIDKIHALLPSGSVRKVSEYR